MDSTHLQSAPAAERNKTPIREVLERVLPPRGIVLEVASGSGQHVVHFARALPALTWQPSDPDPAARASIAAWTAHEGLDNVRPPLDLDAGAPDWPVDRAQAVLCINMIHIAPWPAAKGLVAGAGRVLPSAGILFLYGPFRRDGRHTAPSNADFDAQLRCRNPEWGVRDVGAVTELAEAQDFDFQELVEMPANNCCVVYRKR